MIDLFGFNFHIYGLLIGLGIYVAWEIALKVAHQRGIEENLINKIAWPVILSGIAGARIYHVIDYWQRYYSQQPIKVFYLWEGGLAIWGALIGGFLGFLVYGYISGLLNKNSRVSMLSILDSIAVGLPVAQAIGRVGNWVNGEIVGTNGEPLFAYEAILNLILFGALWITNNKVKSEGKLIGVYLIGYGVIRFFLEGHRKSNEIWKIMNFPVASWVSVLAILVGVWLVQFHQRKHS